MLEAFKKTKELIIENNGTVIEADQDRYFVYELDGKFGAISLVDYISGGPIVLSSEYKPSRENGTGAIYKEYDSSENISLEDLKAAANFRRRNDAKINFYDNIEDYLSNVYDFYSKTIIDKSGEKKALECLKGYYIFVSSNHSPIVHKNINYLNMYYFTKRNDYRVILEIYDDELNIIRLSDPSDTETAKKIISKLKTEIGLNS